MKTGSQKNVFMHILLYLGDLTSTNMHI